MRWTRKFGVTFKSIPQLIRGLELLDPGITSASRSKQDSSLSLDCLFAKRLPGMGICWEPQLDRQTVTVKNANLVGDKFRQIYYMISF